MSQHVRLVRAWSGKVHIFLKEFEMLPAQPEGPWNRVAKPARQKMLTHCGEYILYKNDVDIEIVKINLNTWKSRTLCKNCRPILMALLED